MTQFGPFVRENRLRKVKDDRRYSLRKVAQRVGVEPAYLSKIERGTFAPPGEQTTVRLAEDLGLNPDHLLALGGKVASDVIETILARPFFVDMIRGLQDEPEDVIYEVLDGVLARGVAGGAPGKA